MAAYFAGVDIGSRSAKAVIIKDGEIVSSHICDTGPESAKTALLVMNGCMSAPALTVDNISYVVATGYGRVLVPFANENITEIACHAKGAHWYHSSVRTILDMGGQDCKAINCNEKGEVTGFIMNDKCAGGTGRFLEMIADVLMVPLEEIGKLSLESEKHVPFSTVCAVFAKSEALSLLKKGARKADIFDGLHDAIAIRCSSLLRRITVEADFAITGGIAKNMGMVEKIRKKVGLEPLLASDPQTIGALGAALFARERYLIKKGAS